MDLPSLRQDIPGFYTCSVCRSSDLVDSPDGWECDSCHTLHAWPDNAE